MGCCIEPCGLKRLGLYGEVCHRSFQEDTLYLSSCFAVFSEGGEAGGWHAFFWPHRIVRSNPAKNCNKRHTSHLCLCCTPADGPRGKRWWLPQCAFMPPKTKSAGTLRFTNLQGPRP